MTNLKDKPFALIGVHLNYDNDDATKVKAVMVKEQLNWRTSVDRGAIAEKWKPAGTPNFYIIDPEGVIRFVSVNDLSVGRNPEEVLRVLDALQTDELCPCNWQKGEKTLTAA